MTTPSAAATIASTPSLPPRAQSGDPPPAAPPLFVHSGIDVARFHSMHFLGAVFPLSAGLLLYGWRAALVVAGVFLTAAGGITVWRRIGARGRQINYSHGLWMAMLLSLMLPAHLATLRSGETGWVPLPAIPAAGLILVILLWLLGGVGAARVHPVLVTYLLLVVAFQDLLTPYSVLQPDHLAVGDVLDVAAPSASRGRAVAKKPWVAREPLSDRDAVWAEPASQRLWFYTTGSEPAERALLLLQGLLRDRMPPLEDLIIGGQPGPIGTGSVVFVIIGGLFLLYRGVIDYRIPLLITVFTFVGLMLLPVPAAITDRGPQWWWAVVRAPGVGWATAVTFVNYEMTASPLLFMAFFLATAPALRPMTRRARTVYAILIGLLAAVAQLYLSVWYGPYVALLVASLLTPALDRAFLPRPLV